MVRAEHVERLLLAAILVLAAGLRLHALGLEPWLDEIRTHIFIGQHSLGELAVVYESQNHHVLYSLLAKLSLAGLGDTIFALRLPALIFGLLGIGAAYALGRELASAREGLLAAALLAVSYHHVWFSQNARGYTAMAFFTLLATLLLLRVIEDGRPRDAIAYAVVALLGTYTHLSMGCVVAAHFVVGIAYSNRARATERPPRRVLLLAFGLFSVLVLLAYAPVFPQLWAVNSTEGRDGVVADWHRPSWMVRELALGVGAAFGRAWLGVLALALAAAGLLRLGRRRPVIPALLLAPVLAMALLLAVSGHHLWPRLFFFAIGSGALALVSGAFAIAEGVAARLPGHPRSAPVLGTALVAVLLLASLSTVPGTWAPKQRFLETLALVEEERRPGDAVGVAGGASQVFRDYYGADWQHIADPGELEELREQSERVWLVGAFPRSFTARHPELARVLESDFTLVRRLDGTLHEGTVLVWREKSRRTNGFSWIVRPHGGGNMAQRVHEGPRTDAVTHPSAEKTSEPALLGRRALLTGVVGAALGGTAGLAAGYRFAPQLRAAELAVRGPAPALPPEIGAFREEAEQIFALHRTQTAETVQALRKKYESPVFGRVRVWDLVERLALCIDPSDMRLFCASQLVHVQQILAGMAAAGVRDPDLLLLAIVHDLGKVLLLTGERPENVVCTTRLIAAPGPGCGLDAVLFEYGHGEFIASRLRGHVPEHIVWVARHHNVHLTEVEPFLDDRDRDWSERYLRPFRRFDAGFASAYFLPKLDLAPYRELIERSFPSPLLI